MNVLWALKGKDSQIKQSESQMCSCCTALYLEVLNHIHLNTPGLSKRSQNYVICISTLTSLFPFFTVEQEYYIFPFFAVSPGPVSLNHLHVWRVGKLWNKLIYLLTHSYDSLTGLPSRPPFFCLGMWSRAREPSTWLLLQVDIIKGDKCTIKPGNTLSTK